MDNLPIISFITITYNGFEDTCELIESLQTHIKSVKYEIIVVDNASKNNEAILLKDKYPFIASIRSEENLGFSGGNNLGIKASKGKYIFLINNDTYVTEDCLNYLIERLESNDKIAAVSPKIKFGIPPYLIQFAGFTKLSSITLRNTIIGYGEVDEAQYDSPEIVPYLHGAALLIKREVIKKVGLMPEVFFLYYEELDWCTQLTKAGYELWYEPKCCIYHKESQSTGKISKLKVFFMTRNRLLYSWRNLSTLYKYLSIIYQITIANTKNIIFFLLKGKKELAMATIKGTFAFFSLKYKK